MSRKIWSIVLVLIVYLVFAGGSYFIFSSGAVPTGSVAPTPITKGADGRVVFDPSQPKTEACPLNGVKYSKQQRDWWEKHAPMGVMIENHEDSRPQSGLSYSDVVYEAVAEGGITRFLSVYYCQDAGQLGPVRSARTYFLDFISEYGEYPLYVHVGGANQPGPADALSQIEEYGWGNYNDINQFSVGFPVFWRDYNRLGRNVATEHTMYSSTDKLWAYAKEEREITNVDKKGNSWTEGFTSYNFKDDVSTSKRATSQSMHLEFWEGKADYAVDWQYDPTTNEYLRSNGGAEHVDKNTDKQLSAKNIVVLYMKESSANDGYESNLHLLYGTEGSGKAVVFQDGKRINGTWEKDSRESRTTISDSSGKEIEFNRGKIWFEILPTDGILTVK